MGATNQITTLNNVIDALSLMAQAHYQINSFGFGEIADFATSGKTQYPAMWVEAEQVNISNGAAQTSVRIWLLDRLKKDENNIAEVFSDMMQVGLDVIAQANSPIYKWVLDKNNTITMQPVFEDAFDDEVAGYYFDLVVKIPIDYNRCRIPFDRDMNPGQGQNVSKVTIYDQEGNVVATVDCGGIYTVLVFSGIQDDVSGIYNNSIVENT